MTYITECPSDLLLAAALLVVYNTGQCMTLGLSLLPVLQLATRQTQFCKLFELVYDFSIILLLFYVRSLRGSLMVNWLVYLELSMSALHCN